VNNSSNKTKKFIIDLLFPKFCLGCNKEGSYLCEDCRGLLNICEFSYCLCSQNHQTIPPNTKTGRCNRCQNKKLEGLYFALPYKEGNLTKKLIHQFKYEPYLKDLAKTLASILIEHFVICQKNTNEIWQNSVLIPVPLFSEKLNERGYNQSEELARELSKVLEVPVISDVLLKIKQTESQMKLKKEDREKNLLNAFAIKNCSTPDVAQFLGKKVFLIDDVYTTGSTMEECARVLKNAGAKSVWGICIARES
jgi:ComF family protein